MAIDYLNVYHCHLGTDSGACDLMSYLGRGDLLDVRLAKRFDYRHLGIDLVHEEVILCEGVSTAFTDVAYLANCIDEAEASHVRGKINDRIRQPQIGAAIVLALPPDDEITIIEATELTRRIALSIAGERRLAIYAAIHDPAQATPGARNRHGHLFCHHRETQGDELAGPVIRDLFGRPLRLTADGSTVTVEGNKWPDFYLRKLQAYFAELGIDLVVDPIAPFPGRRWPAHIDLDDPRVKNFNKRTRNLNVEAIHGNPAQLVKKLLRGRSTMRIPELERLIAKFVDNESERQMRFEAILGGPDIVTYAADTNATKPRYLTTASVDQSIRRACELVDRAASEPDARSIQAITAPSHADVIYNFGELLGLSSTDGNPLLLGNNYSECKLLSRAIATSQPVVATIKSALSDPSKIATDLKRAAKLSTNRLVIVPRAESVDDQTLARLILTANERNGRLVLLHDQSKQAGIVSHGLAAYAVDRLAAVHKSDEENHFTAVERFLRAGLISPAVELLAQHRRIEFERVDDRSNERESFDFVVCNDPRRLKDVNEKVRSIRWQEGKIDKPVELGHPLKPIWLSQREWIVFTRTDYSVRPPRIRAGELARILESDSNRNTIHVSLLDGSTEAIKLDRFSHLRPAHALQLREARCLGHYIRLRIEVSDVHHVWAAVLLAVHHRSAHIVIDPQIATDVPTLIAATCRSLPAAILRRDPDAEIAAVISTDKRTRPPLDTLDLEFMPESTTLVPPAVIRDTSLTHTLSDNLDLEDFPEPVPILALKSPPIAPLHERTRAVLTFNPHTRRGFERLRANLAHDNPDRDANAEHILNLCRHDGPMAAIVMLLTRPTPSTREDVISELDLPHELEEQSPRGWSDWDLYLLKIELSQLQFDFASWNVVPAAPASPVASTKRK
jgi:hypothetical protein